MFYFIVNHLVDIFLTRYLNLVDAVNACPIPIANGLFANGLISSDAWRQVTSMSDSDYGKASKIVRELLKQLMADSNPNQFLRKICEFLQ